MEFDFILPAITGASGVFAGCAVLYSKLRPYFPVDVNCWFCNQDTKVAFRLHESWYCPSCQQYNGFTEDGDYNRDLPAQYCESLNVTSQQYKAQQAGNRSTLSFGNGFCQTCNLNQTLKVRALADYTPIHPENYDKEIEDYRKRLENTYALCRACEATLHQTLGKQDSWLKPNLMAWRLKVTADNKAKMVSNIHKSSHGAPLYLHLLRFVGLLISVMLFLSNLHHLQQDSGKQVVGLDLGMGLEQYLNDLYIFTSPLIIAGLIFLLLSIFGSGKESLQVSDALTSFVWVGLLALSTSQQLLSNKDYNSLQVLVSGTAVLLTAWTLVVPRRFKGSRQILRQSPNKGGVNKPSVRKLDDSQGSPNSSFSDEHPDLSPSQAGDLNSEFSFMPGDPVEKVVTANAIDASLGLDATLGSLKISTPRKADPHGPSTPVSPRLLFSEKIGHNRKLNISYCMQKNLVSPSRLSGKNITHSSWVAGGYWGYPVSPSRDVNSHHPVPLFSQIPSFNLTHPLSRSSSQSSGFVSQGSGPTSPRIQRPCSLPNSRHSSLCGDFDHGSLLSEPAYKPLGVVPSLYPSDSASQCGHSRHWGQSRSDAHSLHSCSSAYSDCSPRYTPPFPVTSNSTVYQTTQNSLSENSSSNVNGVLMEGKEGSVKRLTSTKCGQNFAFSCRNPWFAFFLGMSFAANVFFIALLYMQADVQILGGQSR